MCIHMYVSLLLEIRILSCSTELGRPFADGLPWRGNDFLMGSTVFDRFQTDGLSLVSVCLFVGLREIITTKHVTIIWMCVYFDERVYVFPLSSV